MFLVDCEVSKVRDHVVLHFIEVGRTLRQKHTSDTLSVREYKKDIHPRASPAIREQMTPQLQKPLLHSLLPLPLSPGDGALFLILQMSHAGESHIFISEKKNT